MEDDNAGVVNETLNNFQTKIGNEYSAKGIISIFNNKCYTAAWIQFL